MALRPNLLVTVDRNTLYYWDYYFASMNLFACLCLLVMFIKLLEYCLFVNGWKMKKAISPSQVKFTVGVVMKSQLLQSVAELRRNTIIGLASLRGRGGDSGTSCSWGGGWRLIVLFFQLGRQRRQPLLVAQQSLRDNIHTLPSPVEMTERDN